MVLLYSFDKYTKPLKMIIAFFTGSVLGPAASLNNGPHCLILEIYIYLFGIIKPGSIYSFKRVQSLVRPPQILAFIVEILVIYIYLFDVILYKLNPKLICHECTFIHS